MAEPEEFSRLPDAMLKDLELFSNLASDSLLDDIVREIENVPPASSVADFGSKLEKRLGQKSPDCHQVLRTLINLKRVEADTEVTVHDLLERITWHLDLIEPWDDSLLAKWHSLVPKIETTLSKITPDSNVMISAKFAELAYNRQNVLHNSSILTDIRPVFDRAAGAVKGMIVTHSLVIQYSEGMGGVIQELHLTLDWRDVAELRDQCNRADSKAECIKNAMKKLPWTTINYPELSE